MSMLAKLQSLGQILTRRKSHTIQPSRLKSTIVLQANEEAIQEEGMHCHRLKHFHPTYSGQILDGRFKTITKLGFGTGSTIWLAENLQYQKNVQLLPRYVSIKIGVLGVNGLNELVASKHIAKANPLHEGLTFLRTPLDDFQLKTPGGIHTCLVYEPMRETLLRFQYRFPDQKLPLPFFKFFTYCILQSLDYLHNECHLVHTDITDDNIMVTIENDSVLEDFVVAHEQSPPAKHIRGQNRHPFYVSQGEFGPLRGSRLFPLLGDFDHAFPGVKSGYGHLAAIQPHHYRAPEVLLGTTWTFSTDIWNLGLLMWNLLEDISLFGAPAGEVVEYDAHVHLARMITLFGPPPKELVQLELLHRQSPLKKPAMNLHGKVCKTMNEFWGGPFFDEKGDMIRKDLLCGGPKLADTVTTLGGEEKEMFLDFAGGMLQWLPEKRKTAKALLKHPFLDSFYKDRQRHL